MKHTIHLVQTNDIIGTNIILPLALGILWQYALTDPDIKSKWQLGEIVYKPQGTDVAQQLAQGHMVVFSNYVWNYSYHLDLARRIKQINPEITVVFGGPQISPNQQDFWSVHAGAVDLAMLGEGEHVFAHILRTWPQQDLIPGMWTPDYFGGDAPRVQDFPYAASPYLSGFYDSIVQAEHAEGNMIQAVIQTNRGCPYHCTFCEEGKEYKNKMFFYDYDRIRDEIDWCADNRVEYLTIGDDNWGIVEQDVEVMRWIRDAKLATGYPNIVDATYAKNNPENLLAMAQIDQEQDTQLIRGITMALQSLNTPTLNTIKRFNLIPDKQQQLIMGLKRLGVPTYCEMIWPLPYETLETFCHSIDQSIALGLDNWLGVYPLSLLHGTDLYEQHHQDYELILQHSENNNKDSDVRTVPMAVANRWVDRATVIRGQVMYGWVVCLYYLGFGRDTLSRRPITDTVLEFMSWLESHPDTHTARLHVRFQTWWQQYLTGHKPDSLSIFDQNTTHWSPYTHLASWLQHDWDEFFQDWDNFVWQQYGEKSQDRHGTIKYGRTYTNLNHQQPQFESMFEFSRYYYWWNRKRGYSRL
jgi:radical SAM superfamily enzyme YgiQ (UPF0313 family)